LLLRLVLFIAYYLSQSVGSFACAKVADAEYDLFGFCVIAGLPALCASYLPSSLLLRFVLLIACYLSQSVGSKV
jgi:hypothetical protein